MKFLSQYFVELVNTTMTVQWSLPQVLKVNNKYCTTIPTISKENTRYNRKVDLFSQLRSEKLGDDVWLSFNIVEVSV